MFDKLLPQRIDNGYRGHKAALWLFGLAVALKLTQSLAIIFNGYSTASGADGIPLDTYPPAAAQTITSIFAAGSLWRLTFCSVCVIVLVRYRSAVPLMFALLALNYLAGLLILQFIPLLSTGTPPGPYVNFATFILMIVGLILSLRKPARRAHQAI